VPSVAVSLLQEFEDVFSRDFPNILPPLKGIEHHIDLIPGAANSNQPTYKSNLDKMKELQRQVDELMEKEYIYECMNVCAILVLLMLKKDETWRMCVDC
jgi:hypothetical protein